MKKSYSKTERRGLPGGPNEFLQNITQYISVEGYKSDSPDVNNPFNIIESNNITMEGVDFPVRGYGNNGMVQDMKPGELNYNFKDADYVVEVPMAQVGGDPEMIFKEKYNTPLTEEEKIKYDAWVTSESKRQGRDITMDLGAYDIQGFWKSGDYMKMDEDNHGSDKWKKPNHPTFSNQSKYHNIDGYTGGTWAEDGGYTPSEYTRELYDKNYYDRLFGREPNRPEYLKLPKMQTAGETVELEEGVIPTKMTTDGYDLDEIVLSAPKRKKDTAFRDSDKDGNVVSRLLNTGRGRKDIYQYEYEKPEYLENDPDWWYSPFKGTLEEYNQKYGRNYQRGTALGDYTMDEFFRPQWNDMLQKRDAMQMNTMNIIGAATAPVLGMGMGAVGGLSRVPQGLRFLANSPAGRFASKYIGQPFSKAMNYRPISTGATVGQTLDGVGFVYGAGNIAPDTKQFIDNPTLGNAATVGLDALSMGIPALNAGKYFTGASTSGRGIQINQFNDRGISPTNFDDVVDVDMQKIKSVRDRIFDATPGSNPDLTDGLEMLGRNADEIDNFITMRLDEIKPGSEGFNRLANQELNHLKASGYVPPAGTTLDDAAQSAALARYQELSNLKGNTINHHARNMFNDGAGNPSSEYYDIAKNFISENQGLFTNAYFRNPGAGGTVGDVITVNRSSPMSGDYSFTTRLGLKPGKGTIGVGPMFSGKSLNTTLDHEIGHLFNANRPIGLSDEFRVLKPNDLVNTKLDLSSGTGFGLNKAKINTGSKQLTSDYDYFATGSPNPRQGYIGDEPIPFAVELRRSMLERGLINNIYDEITPSILNAAKKSFSARPAGLIEKNPGFSDSFFSNTRLLDFLDPSTYPKLSKLMNNKAFPAIAPPAIIGAAGLNQQKEGGLVSWNMAQDGKEIDYSKYNVRVIQYPYGSKKFSPGHIEAVLINTDTGDQVNQIPGTDLVGRVNRWSTGSGNKRVSEKDYKGKNEVRVLDLDLSDEEIKGFVDQAQLFEGTERSSIHSNLRMNTTKLPLSLEDNSIYNYDFLDSNCATGVCLALGMDPNSPENSRGGITDPNFVMDNILENYSDKIVPGSVKGKRTSRFDGLAKLVKEEAKVDLSGDTINLLTNYLDGLDRNEINNAVETVLQNPTAIKAIKNRNNPAYFERLGNKTLADLDVFLSDVLPGGDKPGTGRVQMAKNRLGKLGNDIKDIYDNLPEGTIPNVLKGLYNERAQFIPQVEGLSDVDSFAEMTGIPINDIDISMEGIKNIPNYWKNKLGFKEGGSVSWQWKGKTYSGTLIPSMENENNRYARTENGKIKTLPKAQQGGAVSDIWENVTGTPWSAAKEQGLTDGSYDVNMKLRSELLDNPNKFKPTPSTNLPPSNTADTPLSTLSVVEVDDRINGAQDFNSAFRIARDYYGPNKIFNYNNKNYGTNLKGEEFNPSDEDMTNAGLRQREAQDIQVQNELVASPYSSTDVVDIDEYEDIADVKNRANEFNKMSQADLIVNFQNQSNNNKPYVIVDKQSGLMHVYEPGNNPNEPIYSAPVDLGAVMGDAQTVTKYVDINQDGTISQDEISPDNIDWSAGNKMTGAGRYKISNINRAGYMDLPSFNLSNESGQNVGTSLHAGYIDDDNSRVSNGCIRCNQGSLNVLTDYLQQSSEVFILPEDEGNKFVFENGQLNFKAGSKRNDYLEYEDDRGNIQKGQGINRTVNTLNYKPIQVSIDDKFKEDQFNETDFFGDDDEEYNNTVVPFAKSLQDNKQLVMKNLKVNGDVYNDLAGLAFGIFGNETGFGDTHSAIGNTVRAGLKFGSSLYDKAIDNLDLPDSLKIGPRGSADYKAERNVNNLLDNVGISDPNNASMGLTQVRWGQILKEPELVKSLASLGITSGEDFDDPKKAALGTVGILAYLRNNREGGNVAIEDLPRLYAGTSSSDPNRDAYTRNALKNSKYLNIKQKKYQEGGPVSTPSRAQIITKNSAPIISNDLLLRQLFKESSFNANATSKKDAKGVAQFTPITIEEMQRLKIVGDDFDPYDINQAIPAQKKWMNYLSERPYLNQGNDESVLAKILFAYNAGPTGAKNSITKLKNKGIDIYNSTDWTDSINNESSDYINKILKRKDSKFNDEFENIIINPKYNDIIEYFKQKGGPLRSMNKIYTNYIKGIYKEGGSKEQAQRVYDKLNRKNYKSAKLANMSIPNYVMTHVIGNS